MENSTENKYKFSKITDKQLKAQGVQALADRPNAVGQYGQSGLSPAQLKLWFDKLVTLAAEKINELQEAINGEEAAKYIGLALENYKTLDELIAAMQDGRFAGEILSVFPSAGERREEHLTALQAVIDDFAKDISSIKENKLDKKKPGVLSAYTVGADNENGTVEISGAPKAGAIPRYDNSGAIPVINPAFDLVKYWKNEPQMPYTLAMNYGFFTSFMANMAEHIGAGVNFTMDPETYIVTIEVLNRAGEVIYRTYLDLPLEEAIVGGSYDEENKEIDFILRSGETFSVKIEDLVNGLVTEAKHAADIKALSDKMDRLFGEYVEEIDELVGGDYVDYSE
ncbi:MAG: hypothetical protein IKJ13_07590 [Clostridia bacterium]|nr:hypothetical protein [Clostridia bacterium]